jgi:O-antigen/teichoic acid export membrane protein
LLKKVLGYSLSTWLGAVLTFALLPIASYIYSTENLGIINYYYSVINIIFTFILLGLDQAFLRFYSEFDNQITEKSMFLYNMTFTFIVSLLLVICCVPFIKGVSTWIIGSNELWILPAITFHLFGLIVTRYFSILYRVKGFLWKYSIIAILYTILLKVIYIAGAIINTTVYMAIIATAGISLLSAIIILGCGRKEMNIGYDKSYRTWAKKEFHYAIPIVPAMLMGIVNNNIPQIVLRNVEGFEKVAIFSIGVTLASTVTLLHNGINTFMEPFVFQNYKSESNKISDVLDMFVRLAFFIGIAIILFEDLFFIVFSKSYVAATHFLPILIASAIWYAIGDFYNIGVKIEKKTYENIIIYVIGVIINLVCCVVFIRLWGNTGAATAAATASLIMCVFKIIRGHKYFPIMQTTSIFILGSLMLILVSVVNEVFWGSKLRHLIILIVWIFSGYKFGIFKQIIILLKNRNNVDSHK